MIIRRWVNEWVSMHVCTRAHTCIYTKPLNWFFIANTKSLICWSENNNLSLLLQLNVYQRYLVYKIKYVHSVTTHIQSGINKLIYLQWTLGDRNNFLPSILVPISCKRGKWCNIIFVDVITVHVPLAKTAMASNSDTTKNISSNILPT